MVNHILDEYRDAASHFMINTSSVGEALEEARKTQDLLNKLIMVERDLGIIAKKKRIEYESFFARKESEQKGVYDSRGVKYTESTLTKKVIGDYQESYLKLSEEMEMAELDYDAAKALKMSLFQRKDIICKFIEYITMKIDSDSCILKNQELHKMILRNING